MDKNDCKITLTQTFTSNMTNLPAAYNITLPGGKKVVIKMASGPNVYPTVFAPSENPAFLYDETGSRIIGIALLEANIYMTNKQIAERYVRLGGGNPNNKKEVEIIENSLRNSQTWQQKLLAFLYLLLPVFILLAAIIFIFYRKD